MGGTGGEVTEDIGGGAILLVVGVVRLIDIGVIRLVGTAVKVVAFVDGVDFADGICTTVFLCSHI